MATHSGILAWRIPGKGEPGGLPSMGCHRVGHDGNDLAAAAAYAFTYGIIFSVYAHICTYIHTYIIYLNKYVNINDKIIEGIPISFSNILPRGRNKTLPETLEYLAYVSS